MSALYLYAGLLGVIAVLLSVRVTMLRAQKKILFGDGGDNELMLAIRRFGNFAELAPLGLLLLAMLAADGASLGLIHGVGIALVAGRAIHPFGMSTTKPMHPARVVGQGLTWAAIGVSAVYLLIAAAG